MKPHRILTAALSLTTPFLFSQAAPESEDMDFLFTRNRFSATWSHINRQLQHDSLNSELNYKMGICYLNSRSQKEKALSCFQKALALQNNNPPSGLTYKLLAEASYLSRNYDQALSYYEMYKKTLAASQSSDTLLLREIEKQLEICRLGKELNELKEMTSALVASKFTRGSDPQPVTLTDYTTSFSADQSLMTVTFRRSGPGGRNTADHDLFADAISLGEDTSWADTRDTGRVRHEATVATSVDGQIILLYRDEEGDAALYVSTLNGNQWSAAEKVNRNLNLYGWEPNEFISADGHTLYFTSSREGGYGGKDIYRSVRMPSGEWGKAVNLGFPINSPYDDEAPFIHPDGVTLCFSSNRQRKDGFDIFTSVLESGRWAIPVNIGYPAGKTTQLKQAETAARTIASTEKDNCLVTFLNQKKNPLIIVKGSIRCKDGKLPPSVQITVSDNATGEITGLYQTNRSGQYAIILPGGKNTNILFEADGYLFHSENMDVSEGRDFYRIIHPIELEPFMENASTVLNNIFFKNDPPVLHSDSYKELHHLFRLMATNPGLVIEICGVLAEKGGIAVKRKEQQLDIIVTQLLENGIDKERIQTKIYNPRKRKRNKPVHPDRDRIELKIVKTNHLK